jgi:hypothetical protein
LPALTGSVSGFVNGQTLSNATTGTPTFSTGATRNSNPGTYGIDGSGLTSDFGNYVFAQAPENTTALVILPPPTPFQSALASADSATGQMSWVGDSSDPEPPSAPSASGPTQLTAVNNATAASEIQLPGVPPITSGQQWGGMNLTVIDGGVNTPYASESVTPTP